MAEVRYMSFISDKTKKNTGGADEATLQAVIKRTDTLGERVNTTVDHVVEGGDWNSSLFLRNTIKPLMAIKAEALAELDQLQIKAGEKSVNIQAAAENEVEVYISLFQSDGYNISKWAMQLRSLDR